MSRVIYCVIPRELADELYDKMVEYYEDNPNVTVIVDRRDGPDRRDGQGRTAASGDPRPAPGADPGHVPGTTRPEAPIATVAARTLPELHRRRVGRRRLRRDLREPSPANGELIGVFPRSGAEDVDRAVAAARAAFEDWRLVPAPQARRAPLPLRAAPRASRRPSSPS